MDFSSNSLTQQKKTEAGGRRQLGSVWCFSAGGGTQMRTQSSWATGPRCSHVPCQREFPGVFHFTTSFVRSAHVRPRASAKPAFPPPPHSGHARRARTGSSSLLLRISYTRKHPGVCTCLATRQRHLKPLKKL